MEEEKQSHSSVYDHKQEKCGKSIYKSHESLHSILPGIGNDERQLKVADSISSFTDDWEGFFRSLVDLLNDCETSSVSTRNYHSTFGTCCSFFTVNPTSSSWRV